MDTQDLSAGERRRRKQARPGEFMAAALALFVEKGYAATRLDDIAQRAGASKGTLYLYFESKEALFQAVIREGILPVLEEGEALVRDFSGSSADMLEALLMGWWRMVGETQLSGIAKLMLAESGNFPEVAQYYQEHVITRGRRLLRGVLELGIARGDFRPLDIEALIDVVFAPVLVRALARHSLVCAAGQSDAQLFLRTHLDVLVHGLNGRQA